MANYTKIVDYAAKDALNTGDPVKLVKGTELGAEYDAIAVAIATKANTASPAFTGVSSFAVGAVGAPSIYMTGYATTGWYNIGANNWGFAVSGAKVLDIASTGLSVTGTVTATDNFVIALGKKLYYSATAYVTPEDNVVGAVLAGTAASVLKVNGTNIATATATGLAVTGALSATGNISASSVSLPDGDVVTWGAGTTTYIQGNQASAYMNFLINSVNRMALTSTGLAVTGEISATSALTLSGTGQVLIATAASADDKYVTISNTNGTLEYGVLAGGEGFIGTSTADNLKLQVNGSVVGNLSSTGLAVTGTIGATSTLTSAVAAGSAAFTMGAAARFYLDGSVDTFITESSGNNIQFVTGGSAVVNMNTTGLAVTGALNATGLIGGRSSNGQAFTTTNGVDADFSITLASGDVQLINTASSSKISTVINGTARAQVSSTGLAVTGEIGASGTITSTASGSILQRTGASTAAQIIRLANTTGDFYFGIESSVAGSYFPTSSAYASVLYSTQPVQTIVGGVKITDTNAAGLAVTGTLSATGNISASSVSLPDGDVVTWGAGTTTYIQGNQASAYMNFLINSVNRMALTSTGLAVTGTLNTATTTALSWGGDTTAGHTLGTRGTGSSLFINTGGLNTSYASGLAVDGSYSSLVSTVNIRALGTYSGGGYEAKLAFFTSSDTTQGQRMLLSSTGLAVTGTLSATGDVTASGGNVLGTREILQNSQSAAYTTVLGDAGKHILHPSADTTARTFTIDSNANVAYPVGTAITFVNQASAGVMTISITSDTMRLAGAGTTGSRTLAANGIATALKLTSTEWIISGTGLT